MKKILLLLSVLLTAFFGAVAQEETEGHDKGARDFRFVYIAHDVNTPVQRLIERLEDYQNNAFEEGEDVIFYLSSGTNPIIVEYNVGRDNKGDFEDVLLSELNERISHDVDAQTDVETILQLIENADIMDEDKNLKYLSAKFNFYVNPKFWTLGNNEAVIAPLFFALDVPHIRGGRVQFQLFEAKEDKLKYPEGKPFGEKNLDGINQFTATDKTQY